MNLFFLTEGPSITAGSLWATGSGNLTHGEAIWTMCLFLCVFLVFHCRRTADRVAIMSVGALSLTCETLTKIRTEHNVAATVCESYVLRVWSVLWRCREHEHEIAQRSTTRLKVSDDDSNNSVHYTYTLKWQIIRFQIDHSNISSYDWCYTTWTVSVILLNLYVQQTLTPSLTLLQNFK